MDCQLLPRLGITSVPSRGHTRKLKKENTANWNGGPGLRKSRHITPAPRICVSHSIVRRPARGGEAVKSSSRVAVLTAVTAPPPFGPPVSHQAPGVDNLRERHSILKLEAVRVLTKLQAPGAVCE